MRGLIPIEHWEYKFRDFLHGVNTAISLKNHYKRLNIPGLGHCIPVRSGRAALITAIRALKLPKGAHIGVPLYCCPVVFKAVEAAGCTNYFLDIDRTTFCISPEDLFKKRAHIDAVIAVHMFGNICDISVLQRIAHGKPIIEDCAQSIGSKLDGRMAGSFGDVAFFSFRSGKYLSVGEGGALFPNNEEIRSILSTLITALPVPKRRQECVHVAKTYIRSMLRSKPLYGLIGYPLWYFYNKTVNYSAKSPLFISQIYKTDLLLTIARLAYLDSAIEKQRANADFYSRTLQLESDMLCPEKSGTFYNRYMYPIIFSSPEQRDFIASYLHKQQIDTAKPYQDIAEIASDHYGYMGDCPTAEMIAKRVLVIPTHHALSKKDIQYIAECLNSVWREIIKVPNKFVRNS
ncbi:MAG: DegT/DnrJ/EryC1/StrS family aminotransferase [Syntrophales bacterium]|jgi:dTDP-4-amino-4,6-dideoxygalactose transaminase